ncbi:hypothetical protein KIPB_013879 [Kipferlia bialata]|uniref:Uncharacterized protein n=1 Tax=Kipferlia bialata TaxID=797122 RepID=A0A9K3D8F4_9EUKA|nr:hypothetical protein KIPB_013879 [Kipferlia bialata]|eukprot:g13879.t1
MLCLSLGFLCLFVGALCEDPYIFSFQDVQARDGLACSVDVVTGTLSVGVDGTLMEEGQEGGFEVYYEIHVAEGQQLSEVSTSIVAIHGGPGSAHNYLTTCDSLICTDPSVAVIYYDQVWCGYTHTLMSR